jgi:hypothetical protein
VVILDRLPHALADEIRDKLEDLDGDLAAMPGHPDASHPGAGHPGAGHPDAGRLAGAASTAR